MVDKLGVECLTWVADILVPRDHGPIGIKLAIWTESGEQHPTVTECALDPVPADLEMAIATCSQLAGHGVFLQFLWRWQERQKVVAPEVLGALVLEGKRLAARAEGQAACLVLQFDGDGTRRAGEPQVQMENLAGNVDGQLQPHRHVGETCMELPGEGVLEVRFRMKDRAAGSKSGHGFMDVNDHWRASCAGRLRNDG